MIDYASDNTSSFSAVLPDDGAQEPNATVDDDFYYHEDAYYYVEAADEHE